MPELPDVTVYLEALHARVLKQPIEKVRLRSAFLVRTADPPVFACEKKRVNGLRRMGKRLVFELEDDLFLVLHLMIAGRLRWEARGAKPPGKISLAAFDFPNGTLLLTEASTRKRASLHVVRGEAALNALDPGGVEVLTASAAAFGRALRAGNHTLKRALTDPRIFSGIGNAYSDEILHAAGLSPVQLTQKLSDAEVRTLHRAVKDTLESWTQKLRDEFAGRFPGPGEITAFRPGFTVHGRYKQPCPQCGTAVQRIRYAENETNYCPRCQTKGKLLADRSLSKLLKKDWPRTIEAMEGLSKED